MHWKTKSYIFRSLPAVPFGTQLHYQLRKRVTHEWSWPAVSLDQLLVAARRVADATQGRHGRFLETGAGQDLAVAIALPLLGVEHLTCVDVSRLARSALVAHAAAHMAECLGKPIPALHNWSDIERFGIRYIAPTGLQQASVEPMSFDSFYSINTLEHMYVDRLRDGEFETLFEKTGMKVLSAECDHSTPEPQILQKLAPEFRGREVADLFTIRAMIVANA